MANEMIERVARAMAPKAFKTFDLGPKPHPGVPEDYGEKTCAEPGYAAASKAWVAYMNARENVRKARRNARRAIEAMREPTEAMRHAYPAVTIPGPFPTREDGYRAMIDAALAEGTEAATTDR
jgi:hypothetical protein